MIQVESFVGLRRYLRRHGLLILKGLTCGSLEEGPHRSVSLIVGDRSRASSACCKLVLLLAQPYTLQVAMAEPSTSFLAAIDGQLDSLFAGWNVYSTTLVAVFVGYLFYPLFFGAEPDTHPLLLARQASASPVRQAGESATYRAIDIPYGYPLRSGLNVKDEGAPKWSAGRNGDLRDIWREAAKSSGPHETPIQLLSVKGKDEPAAYGVEGISKDINVIGTQIQSLQGKRVAIYLPNSVEFLVTLFGDSALR